VSSAAVHAQAWVPPGRTGSVNFAFQWIDNTGHILDNGRPDEMFPGGSQDASVYLALEYAFTDRLSAEIGLPFVWAKYVGPGPTPGPIFQPVDSCYCWHGGFQDFGLIARYNAVGDPGGAFALTPSIAVGAPSNNYAYQGEAVVGRNLREVALGLDVGQRLDPISPNLSLQAHYAYAFVEKVLDVSTNRSNFALEADYELTRKLAVRGLAYWQWTHGGLRVPQDITPENFLQHDRLLRNDYFHAGAGATYQLSRLDIYATYVGFVSGTNTHKGWATSMGVSWPFELGGGSVSPPEPGEPAPR
jgi:hypothetical protein